jgi:hypothetical protein
VVLGVHAVRRVMRGFPALEPRWEKAMSKNVWPKLLVSVVALASLLLVVFKGVEVQSGIVALVAIAILPWVAAVIETMELPGGGKVMFREVRETVKRQEEQLNEQQKIITQLVIYSMSGYIFELLARLYHGNRDGGEYLFRDDEAMKRDLRYLRDHGYLEHFYIGYLNDGENLIGKIRLTPVGNFLVELREPFQARSAAEAARRLA